MGGWLRSRLQAGYERHVCDSIEDGPRHVAVIQDGNRRYARSRGVDPSAGHHEGAETTEAMLRWCDDVGVRELTVYAFSTENFDRPPEEREALFELIATKLREFADAEEVHDREVCIRAIGDRQRLPDHVREAIVYAEDRTGDYDRFILNVALAYGGRTQLLGAARNIARAVDDGELAVDDIDLDRIETRLYHRPLRDVDLIIRTGGDERTSNFLPWHANGNEAAVYFSTAYWPEFRKIDFLRGIRTYAARETSWRRSRARRAVALLRAMGETELADAHAILARFRTSSPIGDRSTTTDDGESERPAD